VFLWPLVEHRKAPSELASVVFGGHTPGRSPGLPRMDHHRRSIRSVPKERGDEPYVLSRLGLRGRVRCPDEPTRQLLAYLRSLFRFPARTPRRSPPKVRIVFPDSEDCAAVSSLKPQAHNQPKLKP